MCEGGVSIFLTDDCSTLCMCTYYVYCIVCMCSVAICVCVGGGGGGVSSFLISKHFPDR